MCHYSPRVESLKNDQASQYGAFLDIKCVMSEKGLILLLTLVLSLIAVLQEQISLHDALLLPPFTEEGEEGYK